MAKPHNSLYNGMSMKAKLQQHKPQLFSSCIIELNFGAGFINSNISSCIMAHCVLQYHSPPCPIPDLMLNKDYHSGIYLFFDATSKDLKSSEKLVLCAVFLVLLSPSYHCKIMVTPQQILITPCFCLHRCLCVSIFIVIVSWIFAHNVECHIPGSITHASLERFLKDISVWLPLFVYLKCPFLYSWAFLYSLACKLKNENKINRSTLMNDISLHKNLR